jgi:ABC-type lipoprotein export system ATPase subunit
MITNMQTNLFVRLSDVSKIYSRSGVETIAIRHVTFQACAGELILLLGPSGSGKTTLLTILAGLQKPSEGEVSIFGRNVIDYSQRDLQKLRAQHIGFIFQTFYLLDSLSVIDNIMMVMKFAGLSGVEANKRALDFLDRFGIKKLIHAFPKTLSQGEKQRVAVARALANGAELILADEPTGSLSTQQGMSIIQFLKDAVKLEGRCVVIASHDERIRPFADRILNLRDGELV